MEDSYIISNFHSLCRLCLHKSELMVSIYSPPPDEDTKLTITSKITDCFELQMHPNDGLPGKICYKCLYEIDKCSKFRVQCIQNETRLRRICSRGGELDHSTSSELSNCTQDTNLKLKQESYVVEDSVVMVVDPSMDYDSSEESAEEPTVDNIHDREPIQENFLKDIAMCQYCDQAFVSQEKCSEHELAYHDPSLPFSCVECSLVFSERSQHVQHTRHVHHNDKPYQCLQCEKSFGRRSDLRKHAIVHTGIRPYQCHYCMKNFSRNTNLSKHLRIHAGEKPHVCPLCPRSFVCNGDLQRHVLIHSGTKPYACRKCPQTFSRRDKLVKHQMKHGPNSPDLRLPESEADQETHDMVVNINPFSDLLSSPTQLNADQNNEYDLPRVPDHIAGVGSFLNQQHLQKKPSTSVKPVNTTPPKTKPISNKNKPKNIKCHQCPKRFSSLDAYKTHVSVAHIGSRGFLCKICFKKFSRRRDLDRHAAIHNRSTEFSCSQCDMKFTQKDLLDKHEETHESLVANLPCIECGATFEKKAELVAHIKSHFVDDFEEKSPEDEPKKELSSVNSFFDLET